METTSDGKSFGNYLGLGGKSTKYFGCFPGSPKIGFGPNIVGNVCEIKFIEHTNPFFLVGVDILYKGAWG